MNLPHLPLRSAIALVTFIVALAAASLWFSYRFPVVGKLEDPNCLELADYERAIVRCTQSEAVKFCDVVHNPARYNRKIIRVSAIIVGYHHQHLYDPACNGEGTDTWADYDSPESVDKMMKAVAALNGRGLQRGNIWANVILVGQFEERQPGDPKSWVEEQNVPDIHPIKDRFRFVIMNVEHAEPVGPEVSWPTAITATPTTEVLI